MFRKSLYIVWTLLVIITLGSCNFASRVEKESTLHQMKGHTKAVIQNMQSLSISNVFNTNVVDSIYQNKTRSDKSIGQYVHLEISTLYSKQYGLNLPINSNLTRTESELLETYNKSTSWYVQLTFDNDIFSNTDYYYTHGVSIDIGIPFLLLSPFNKILLATKSRDIEFTGFNIKQNIYTPTNPDTEDILYGDRPFSSYLTVGQFRTTYDMEKRFYVKSQIHFGVLGPASMGGQLQTAIHEITPVGWKNQLDNTIIIDYNVNVRKGLYNSNLIDINLHADGHLGTLYTNMGGGFDLRLGKIIPFYAHPIQEINLNGKSSPLKYWFFFTSTVKLIGYDATLQGSLFGKTQQYTIQASELNRFVFQASAGIALYYKNLGAEYAHSYLTPEFKGARHFGWGSIKISLAF